MKTILVDVVYCFVSDTGEIFKEIYQLLESYPNRKILLTSADNEQFKKWRLDTMPYPVFTLKHKPEKTDPVYYEKMLEHFGLQADDVVYFEHNPEAVRSAQSVGIKSYFYDSSEKEMDKFKNFLDTNL